jgi:intergrase/recombinase
MTSEALGVPESVADFIQGRIPKRVGAKHYTQLVNFSGQDEFVCKTAKTTTQAKELIEPGFEYVCDMEDVKLFRKRK